MIDPNDYHAIGMEIIKTIGKVSKPLTQNQQLALYGALSAYLDEFRKAVLASDPAEEKS